MANDKLRGPAGLQGPSGPQGVAGVQGEEGATGEPGPIGEPGATGGELAGVIEDTAVSIKRSLFRLMVATVVMYLALALMGGWVYYESRQNDIRIAAVAKTNAESLCEVRRNEQRRLVVAKDFLRENPDGTPGISRAIVEGSIKNHNRMIFALRKLDCPPPASILEP